MTRPQAPQPPSDATGAAQGVPVAQGANGGADGAARAWTLTIASEVPMLNLNQRMHWAKKAQLTKHWRTLALVNAMAADLPRNLDRIHVIAHVTKPTNRQYDVHNLLPTLKAAVDGLVDYGLIPDDTNQHLVGPDLRQGGKGDAAIVITITELTQEEAA